MSDSRHEKYDHRLDTLEPGDKVYRTSGEWSPFIPRVIVGIVVDFKSGYSERSSVLIEPPDEDRKGYEAGPREAASWEVFTADEVLEIAPLPVMAGAGEGPEMLDEALQDGVANRQVAEAMRMALSGRMAEHNPWMTGEFET